ncbi:MAG: hypothetical protein GYB33_10225 [Gammaproteobacteria bacterium]|uniref:hypothetical protein n=1 Tax=Pseudomaricurvus alcaniphilus TaxID=1166482 RepID=UPI0014073205|nr:hypothetical protein [Pseudomaricurvus alcaniphilus]MBR9910710.1 hypothetical protein [Gammaproteobacteria bacterium]NHN39050.1 hypothetical protein [Pseudomaricurvus alcaniphilus]
MPVQTRRLDLVVCRASGSAVFLDGLQGTVAHAHGQPLLLNINYVARDVDAGSSRGAYWIRRYSGAPANWRCAATSGRQRV